MFLRIFKIKSPLLICVVNRTLIEYKYSSSFNKMDENNNKTNRPGNYMKHILRLGLADVKVFGLFREDCNEFQQKPGYVLISCIRLSLR